MPETADDVHSVRAQHDKLLRDPGHGSISPLHIRRSSGVWINAEGIATNLLENPAVKGIVIKARDVTERKKAEKEREVFVSRLEDLAVKAQIYAQELEAVFASLSQPVMIYDMEGTVVNANNACVHDLGFDPKGMESMDILRRISSRLTTGERTTVEQAAWARAQGGEIVF